MMRSLNKRSKRETNYYFNNRKVVLNTAGGTDTAEENAKQGKKKFTESDH